MVKSVFEVSDTLIARNYFFLMSSKSKYFNKICQTHGLWITDALLYMIIFFQNSLLDVYGLSAECSSAFYNHLEHSDCRIENNCWRKNLDVRATMSPGSLYTVVCMAI